MPSPVSATAANREALALGRGRIAEHARVFAAFEAGALAAADPLEAATLAHVAYAWANRKHPGRLVSAPLERLLAELGRAHVPGREARRPAQAASVERVLHIATQVYATGGHTRVLERWLERDTERRSTVLLLRQDDPIPAALERAADATGAAVVRTAPGDLFTRARRMRALAALHDLVVLHVSPFEVDVALAFADPAGRPPTVMYNHASHHAWTGVAGTDVVASLWEPDAREAVERRGFDAERSVVLPLPAAPRPLPSREAARAELGIAPSTPVLLTVASPYKLGAVLEPSFRDLGERLLDALPGALLLLAGPGPQDGVAPLHERCVVLGPVADLAPHLAAADLMLDGWPGSGATTMLDAAAAALPVLSLGAGDPAEALIRPPRGLLNGLVTHADDEEELVARARELLADPAERRARGAAGRAAVEAHHGEAGWRRELEATVAVAVAHAGQGRAPGDLPAETPTDAEAVLELLYAGDHADITPYHVYGWAISELPPERRPRDAAEIAARVDALIAAIPEPVRPGAPARVVAAPELEAGAVARLLDDVRRRVAAGEVGSAVVVVAPADLERAVPLLERALAQGEDVDIELVAAESVAAVALPGDVVVSG